MKKILFALASFALISSAHAGDGADVKFNAEMWMKYYSNQNGDFTDRGTDTYWTQRNKLGVHFSKGDDLGAQVTLLNGYVWGNNTPSSLAADPTKSGLGYKGEGVDVYEAWAFWKAMDNAVVKIGRGAMDLADGTVVSRNDDKLHPYAFDGVLGVFYTEPVAINFFGVKAADESNPETSTIGAQEVNFYGLSFDVRNLPEVLKMVNVHVLQQKSHDVSGANASKTRYGVTVKGDVSGFDYRGTYAAYTGKIKGLLASDIDTKANMFDLEAGYTLKDMMGLRVSVLYHKDSGSDSDSTATVSTDNKHYDSFFYDEHNNAGLMDVVKWGNLKYYKVGVSVEPMEMTTVGFDYYAFSKSNDQDQVEAAGGTAGALNPTKTYTTGTESKVGTEWDLHASKKLSNGTMLGLRYSQFSPEENSFGGKSEKFSQMYAEAKFTF